MSSFTVKVGICMLLIAVQNVSAATTYSAPTTFTGSTQTTFTASTQTTFEASTTTQGPTIVIGEFGQEYAPYGDSWDDGDNADWRMRFTSPPGTTITLNFRTIAIEPFDSTEDCTSSVDWFEITNNGEALPRLCGLTFGKVVPNLSNDVTVWLHVGHHVTGALFFTATYN